MSKHQARGLRIGIVGAGTAGLAAASAFARRGHAVTVFEKHAGLATLGAGLLIQPQGVAALGALGVGQAFEQASVPINHLLGLNQRRWRIVDIPYREHPARAVNRAALAQLLHDAALANGVRLRFDAPVDQLDVQGQLGVACLGEERAGFDLLVIADGAASALPAAAGLAVPARLYPWGALWGLFEVDAWAGEQVLAQRYDGTEKMFGLMPTARVNGRLQLSLFWSLRRDAYAEWKAASLDDWKAGLLAMWPQAAPVLDQVTTHERLTFATYYHARPARLARPPICIIGDAAHAMSPQLGLGATLAVQDALLLAEQVDMHGATEGALRFSKRRLRTVRAYQALSRMLTPCFQANGNGWWRDLVFAGGLYVPGVQRLMYRGVAEPVPIRQEA
ncbi:MAG: NAD(P)/FAD-dependent oxidoreductase [Pseudomonadota bacterium]